MKEAVSFLLINETGMPCRDWKQAHW